MDPSTYQFRGKLPKLSKIYSGIEEDFKDKIQNLSSAKPLFRLFELPGVEILSSVVRSFLSKYDPDTNTFVFGNIKMQITLEDVLFLTGLPIKGKPILCVPSRTPDFRQILELGEKETGEVTYSRIEKIVFDKNRDESQRMKALLLLVIDIFITTRQTSKMSGTFSQFVSNLNEVDKYAWGAALLAHLYSGLRDMKDDANKNFVNVVGNMWVVLCFFFIRIRGLRYALKVHFELENNWSIPLMVPICRSLTKLQHDHYESYMPSVRYIIDNLSKDDIEWKPYDGLQLPREIEEQKKFGTLLVPIFCNSNVVHHRPHLVPNQFSCLDGCDLSKLLWKDKKIKIKKFKGPEEQNFDKHYKKELEQWNSQKLVTDFLPGHFADAGGSGANEAEQPTPTPTHPEEVDQEESPVHDVAHPHEDMVEKSGNAEKEARDEDESDMDEVHGQQDQSPMVIDQVHDAITLPLADLSENVVDGAVKNVELKKSVELKAYSRKGKKSSANFEISTPVSSTLVQEPQVPQVQKVQAQSQKHTRGDGSFLRPRPPKVNKYTSSGN